MTEHAGGLSFLLKIAALMRSAAELAFPSPLCSALAASGYIRRFRLRRGMLILRLTLSNKQRQRFRTAWLRLCLEQLSRVPR
jgi:hypothetical protein